MWVRQDIIDGIYNKIDGLESERRISTMVSREFGRRINELEKINKLLLKKLKLYIREHDSCRSYTTIEKEIRG